MTKNVKYFFLEGMASTMDKSETTFPPSYAENNTDLQSVTSGVNNEEKYSENDPLLQKPTEIENREKVVSKGSSATVCLNNPAKQSDVTMQLTMVCIYNREGVDLVQKNIYLCRHFYELFFLSFPLFSYVIMCSTSRFSSSTY